MQYELVHVFDTIIEHIPEPVIQFMDMVVKKIPPPVIRAMEDLISLMDRKYWWAIVGGLFTLLIVIRIIRRVKKRRLKKAAAAKARTAAPVMEIPTEADLPDIPAPKADTSPPVVPETEEPENFLTRLKSGLSKTRKSFSENLDKIFSGGTLDDDMLEEIEELLITSDIGVSTTMALIEKISAKSSEITSNDQLRNILKQEILTFIESGIPALPANFQKPHIIMVVGVNGVGKTTTIGKLAVRYAKEGKKVLIAACDTFRAAASEQLSIWADRAGVEIVKHKENADPSAVAFDSMEAALARNVDIVLVDTAGRLHTRKNLMEELKKIRRTLTKKIPDAPHETLLVLDATTGQNALIQAKQFLDTAGVTSIALTKLDGTAKGGIVVGICHTLNIPLRFIGVGEKETDLQDFNPKQFVDALF